MNAKQLKVTRAATAAAAAKYDESYAADFDPADPDSHAGAVHDAIAAALGEMAVQLFENLGCDGLLSPNAATRLRGDVFIAYAECDTRV
jgi:D-alanine-D-alanine ligase-like ATP-grasp enzyme